VPILPELAQELHTHLGGRVKGYLFETNHRAAFSPRRIQPLVMAAIANDKDHSILWWGTLRWWWRAVMADTRPGCAAGA
jgi:hypothetical protein